MKRIKALSLTTLAVVIAILLIGLGGCARAPAQPPLHLVSLQVTGYGIVEVPQGVEAVHRNWVGPDSRIELEFNKELRDVQDLDILIFQGGEIRTAYAEDKEVEWKFDYYKIEGKKLSIQPVNPERGLHTFFVTVILPRELKAPP